MNVLYIQFFAGAAQVQDIIQRVLTAEQEAETVVREAREQAARIRAESDADVSRRLEQARADAQTHVQKTAQAAREDARRARDQALANAAEDTRRFETRHADRINNAVDTVCAVLVTPEYDRI